MNFIGGIMTVVSSRVFAENPIHYLDLARKEEIAVKRGKDIISLTKKQKAKNNIDPDDPFWDDPRNVEAVERAIQRYEDGETTIYRLTPEKEKEWFGDL